MPCTPVATTDRLLIRRPEPADAAAVFRRYSADPEVTRLLGWPRHQRLADTQAFIEFSDQQWSDWPAGPCLMERRDNGVLVGGTGLSFESATVASTGYVLARDQWGQGLATEALRAMTALAAGLGVIRLYALCHTAHPASWSVLEKCGFSREDRLEAHTLFPNLDSKGPLDVFCYARYWSEQAARRNG